MTPNLSEVENTRLLMKLMETAMKQPLKLLLGVVIITLISGCSHRQTKSNSKNTKSTNDRSSSLIFSDTLSFLSSANDTLATIQVAVANEPNERNEGLMDVNNLPQDRGMLFIFEEQQPLSFWMANTPLPLDIFFVNKDMEIVRIHRNTQPFTEENFTSDAPAIYAVETNGGFAVAHDIQEGMQITF